MKLPVACRYCKACHAPFERHAVRMSRILGESEEDAVREDYCEGCWQPALAEDCQTYWRSTAAGRKPAPARLSRDDEVNRIETQVENLSGSEPEKLYLLGLFLLKRRLASLIDSRPRDDGSVEWRLRVRGRRRPLVVTDLGSSLLTDGSRDKVVVDA